MNRKKAAELLPIIKAFSEGKTIECRNNRVAENWKEVSRSSSEENYLGRMSL